MTAPFYIVFSPQGVTPPAVQHETHGKAYSEAHRLAKAHPGSDFFVMKSKSKPIRVEPEQSEEPTS